MRQTGSRDERIASRPSFHIRQSWYSGRYNKCPSTRAQYTRIEAAALQLQSSLIGEQCYSRRLAFRDRRGGNSTRYRESMNRRRQVPSPRVPHRSSMEEGCSRNCGDGDRRRDRDQGSGARKLPRRGEVSRTRHRHSGGGLSLWLVAVSLACLCLCQGAWALGLGSVALRVKAKAKAKGNRGRISLYRLNNNRYNATCLDGG